MEFVAKRRHLKVSIEGESHLVRFPTLGELDDYLKELKSGGADGNAMLTKFLEGLGLPQAAQLQLEAPDLGEIVELLTDQKKV